MECLSCQKEIPASSRFCNFCGQEISHNFSLHPVPEGFVFDKISGWYHKIELKRDRKGKLIQEVTYFNPEKNWFLAELPPEHPSYKTNKNQTENGPIGEVADYLFDEIQELYYLTDVQTDTKTGETIQRVSYFNPKEKAFTNVNYLILDVNPRTPAKPITTYIIPPSQEEETEENLSQTKGKSKKSPKAKREKPKKEKQRKTKKTVLLRILSFVLGIMAILLGIYYCLVWFGIVPAGTLEAGVSNVTNTIQKLPSKISSLFVKKTSSWPEFPHVSSLYKKAFQEGDSLYFLGTTPTHSAALYRFDTKTGESDIVIESPDATNLLAAFTVTPKYIYYSLAKENDSEAKYYRMQKETGEFQYLFKTDNSSLVATEDNIYIILSANNKLRKINEKTENPNDFVDFEIPPATDDSYVLSNNFSIVGDDLYYCELKNKNFMYYRYNLVDKSKEQLLGSETEQATIINPYWIDGKANYALIDEASQTIRLLQEDVDTTTTAELAVDLQEDPTRYFAVTVGNQVVYATNQGTMLMDLKQQSVTRISTSAPVAICKDWIVLENSVYSLLNGSLHYVLRNGSSMDVKETTLGQSGNLSAPSSTNESDSQIPITIHHEMFEAAALMAVNNPYDELRGEELVSQLGILFTTMKDTSNLLDHSMVNTSAMSDLLWELFSVDYNYFEEIVHTELAAGFIMRSDGIQFDSEKAPKLEGISIQSVEKAEDTDNPAMRVIVVTPRGQEEYLIFYEENEIYSISQYKIIATQRVVDKIG